MGRVTEANCFQMRRQRRQLLRARRPAHYCPGCRSVTFASEDRCLHCTDGRPPTGWPALAAINDLWLGRILDGRYLLTSPLGRGTFGGVYRAESLSVARQFAIKLIATDEGPAAAAQIVPRLHREVEALSRLHNPHIVSFYEIFDVGHHHMAAVMDLVDGQTLHQLVPAPQGLAIPRACAILRQVANGLYEAHQAGIVHRDLKPDNLMVERLPAGDDFAHILDFGILHLTDEAGAQLTHGFIGTPAYASPEQAMAKPLDHRSDIYSLGATLYFMLTGRPPFDSDQIYDVLRMHVHQAPPTLAQGASGRHFPPALERLTATMLAKQPHRRPADLSAVIDDLDRFRRAPRGPIHQGDGDHRRHPAATGQAQGPAGQPIPAPAYTLHSPPPSVHVVTDGAGAFCLWEPSPNEILYFDAPATAPAPLPLTIPDKTCAIALTPDHLITGHQDGTIARTELTTGDHQPLDRAKPCAPIAAVATDRQARRIVVASHCGQVYARTAAAPSAPHWRPIRHGAAVRSLALNARGDLVAIARGDKTVELLDLANPGVPSGTFPVDAPIRAMAISPDNYLLAAVLANGHLAIYHLPTGQPALSLNPDQVEVLSIWFADDPGPTAICAIDYQLRVLPFDQLHAWAQSR